MKVESQVMMNRNTPCKNVYSRLWILDFRMYEPLVSNVSRTGRCGRRFSFHPRRSQDQLIPLGVSPDWLE